MLRRFALLLAFILFSCCGCGGGGSSAGGGAVAPEILLAASPSPSPSPELKLYLLVANSPGNSIDVFSVDPVTGRLRPTARSPVTTPGGALSIERHPTQPFVYVGCLTGNGVLGYNMDARTGALTLLPGFPVTSETGNNVIIDRTGTFLYSIGETEIDGFRINQTTGALTRLAGFPVGSNLGDLRNGTFDRNNRFLYVADFDNSGVISYALNNQTGALTEVARVTGQTNAFAVEVDPSNQFLYVSEANGVLNGFRCNSDGTLTQLAGLPVIYAPNGSATARFTFRDQFLYIGDRTSHTMNAFAVDSGTGQLTPVGGYPKAGGSADMAAFPLPSTPFLYAGDRPSNVVNGFTIGAGAATTAVPGSPFQASGGPNEVFPIFFFL